jgi:Icc-related predicted phosphoesterase/uncharacterized protein YprB with RNaseH-like and TPR domain
MRSAREHEIEIQRLEGRPERLKLLLLSDCHTQPIPEILKRVQHYQDSIDAILYGGDGLPRFHTENINYLEALAAETKFGLFAVVGNDDPAGDKPYISGEKVYDVHHRPVVLGQFAIVGQEGFEEREDLLSLGKFGYTQEQIENRLREILIRLRERTVVILSHTPPAGSLDRAVRFGDLERCLNLSEEDGYDSSRIGSEGLASILGEYDSVRAVVCGHVHKMGGRVEETDTGTYVVNVASHDTDGAALRIGSIDLHVSGKILGHNGQLSRRAFEEDEVDELRRIPGIGRKTARKLVDFGIENLDELASASPDALEEEIPHTSRRWRTLIGRAEAHHTGHPVFLGTPELPSSPRLYLDIETDLKPTSLVWLIGIYQEEKEDVQYFFAERPEQEKEILKSFLSFLEQNPEATLLHYSTKRFDERILQARLEANNLPIPSQLQESVDVGIEVENCVALPRDSNGLSAVAEHIGYEFAHPNMDGIDVASAYLESDREEKEVPEEVFEYNRDDVLAVREIVEWLEAKSSDMGQDGKQSGEATGSTLGGHRTPKYQPVIEKLVEIEEDKAVVLSGLSKNDVDDLMSDLYGHFSPERVAVRYAEEAATDFKAVVYLR